MVKDALSKDNLIAIVLLKDGWEKDYFGNPEVHTIACVGEIQHSEKLDDGKYNIMLYGLSRVQIMGFVQNEPYRIARVKYLSDQRFNPENINEHKAVENFLQLVKSYLEEMGVEGADDLFKLQSYSLESIINQVASILDFSSLEKQQLLEINHLDERYTTLRKFLVDQVTAIQIARKAKFVPDDPSLN
jgi:Lon protease-like protein